MSEYVDVYEHRVRFAELDAQGIVFYGTYFTYQDEAFVGYMRRLREARPDLRDDEWEVHVVNAEMDYRDKATGGEALVHGMRVDRIGESSIEWAHRVRRREDGRPIAEGSLTHVMVDAAFEGKMRVPDRFREAVREFQDVPPEDVG